MGFMDTLGGLKDRLLGTNDDFYEDEYEEDFVEDEYLDDEPADVDVEPPSRVRPTSLVDNRGSGLLGNSARPEAESVAVFTRSGERVVASASPSTGGYTSPSSFAADTFGESSERGDNLIPIAAALPPTVLRPQAYGDIQSIIRRVRTPQAVVLDLRRTPMDEARRILDFSFGLACGIEGSVDELGERVFCLLPRGVKLSSVDMDRLARERVI